MNIITIYINQLQRAMIYVSLFNGLMLFYLVAKDLGIPPIFYPLIIIGGII